MRHSWVRISLAAAVLTAVLTISAAAASLGTGVVNASALHLRAAASTDSASLCLVYNGAQVDILEDTGNGWYQVSYNGQTGYMSADYLVVSIAAGEADVQPQDEVEKLGNGKVTTNSSTLNLRAEPSTGSKKLASIPNGTVLALDGQVDGWYQVTYRGLTGYVSADYIVLTTETVAAETASAAGSEIVAKAMQYLGCPYVYGSAGPNSFDCSGFTSFIYKQFGYSINRTASGQLNNDGVPVDRANLQPGDLVFFRDYSCTKSASHVGIYIGNGQFIHASSSRSATGVKISGLSETWYANRYVGARRVVA